MSVYGFPESADWRALGEVCEFWDVIGRKRIQDYILNLADYSRQKIISRFGEGAMLQPVKDPELKSGIIAFNPLPEKKQRLAAGFCFEFRDRMFREYGYHIGAGGLGRTGLTRPPDPEAGAFPEGCIPNCDPVTGKPAPTEIPFRFNACIWNTRRDIDRFLDAAGELAAKMTA